jgi:hypothetical protein
MWPIFGSQIGNVGMKLQPCPSRTGASLVSWRTLISGKLSLVITLLLYAWVGFSSPGYEDDIFNMEVVERANTLAELYHGANLTDVHPPGQYLINKALWDATGNWSTVRAATAVAAAITIWLVWRIIRWPTPLTAAFAFLTICLNPALLLWCTGLRWYAYFVPLFNLMTLLILRNPASPVRFWGSFFLLAVALLLIGYVALILAAVAFLVAVYVRRQVLRTDLRFAAVFAVAALLLSSHQLIVFLTVHAKNRALQTSGFGGAILGLGLHVLSNQGAYPISAFGVSLIVGNLLLFAVGLIRIRALRLNPASALFIFGALGLCATTLSGKIRNMVTVSTAQGVFQAELFGHSQTKPLMTCALLLIAIGNIGSTFNVVMHRDTTKGSWNTPYAEVLADLREKRKSLGCARLQVITHDVVVTYYASRQDATVVVVGQDGWREQIRGFTGCRAAIQTYRGSMDGNLVEEYAHVISDLPHRVETMTFGSDRYAGFKRSFDPDIPDYYVRITYFTPS